MSAPAFRVGGRGRREFVDLGREAIGLARDLRRRGAHAGNLPGAEQAALVAGRHGGRPVVDPELRVDVQQVRLDRRLGDEQLGGGLAVGSSRIAVTPSPPGIRRSISTTWGRRATASATASTPAEASPSTSNSGSPVKIPRSPLRTTGWSSAISSEITPAPPGRWPRSRCPRRARTRPRARRRRRARAGACRSGRSRGASARSRPRRRARRASRRSSM